MPFNVINILIILLNLAVGTPLCWQLTRCHRVLPSQVSYGWIGWVGVGIKYSKPFDCICKHTAARIRILRGCPAGGRFPPGECFLALGFALLPVSYSLQSRQRPQPDPRTLDEFTPRQYWSANFINRMAAVKRSTRIAIRSGKRSVFFHENNTPLWQNANSGGNHLK